jgi:hypothetical protein
MNFPYPSDKDDEVLLVKYLKDCSEISLDNIFLTRLDYDRKLQKDILTLVEKAIENMAFLRLVEILRRHPELRPKDVMPEAPSENVHGDSVALGRSGLRGEQRDGDGDGAPPMRVPLADGIRDRVRRQRSGRSRPVDSR